MNDVKKTVLLTLILSLACGAPGNQAPQTAEGARALPPDAAPRERQTLRQMTPEPISLDSSIFPYDTRGTILPFEPLLSRDEDMQPAPGAASSWETSPDATRWTFHLRSGARWSDGHPVTANDFVYTFRRVVDPASANIYAFFYYDFKNARAINHGEIKDITRLGVQALDDTTLVIETEHPAPYLPHVVSFGDAFPVPRWAVEKYGRQWTEGPNIVTNSGFNLREWVRGSHMTFVPDPNYNGPCKPYLSSVIHPFRSPDVSGLLSYENNEVDIERVDIHELERIENDPKFENQLVRGGDPVTWYIFFRTQEAPFSDIRVREAFTRAIDRETLCRVVLKGAAVPAYSMLPPGFAEYDAERYKKWQGFDPQRAKTLMAEAGYPGGRGFPAQDFWLRAPGPTYRSVAEAIQGMIKEHLGVTLDIRSADDSAYMNQLYDWKMNIGLLNFGVDFMDPRNMLDMTWRSQPRGAGRQDWTNPAFDRLVQEAIEITDNARRNELYRQAEEILVSDYGAAFIYYPMGLQLRKPWVRGYKRNPDGTVAPRLDYTTLYIGQ